MNISEFEIKSGKGFKLTEEKAEYNGRNFSDEKAKAMLRANVKRMFKLQHKLYAQNEYALLIIFQAMDTAGKDGAIKHVMTGLNPQGTHVHSFKKPSEEELSHDYLWRASFRLPQRGQIGIFNRSYYEEVLVVRAHNLLKKEKIPRKLITDNIWDIRFRQIRNFEKYLYENGIIPIKLFLHISKDEQKMRILERIEDKSKNWKFSADDIEERKYWDNYQQYYQDAIRNTAAKHAPWYIIPANNKIIARLIISEIIVKTLQKLDIDYPALTEEQQNSLNRYRDLLLSSE